MSEGGREGGRKEGKYCIPMGLGELWQCIPN